MDILNKTSINICQQILKHNQLRKCIHISRKYNGGRIQVSAEVEDAVNNQMPVVALESAIITHGMPYPDNFQTAQSVERIVRENGAIPATVAVINGQIFVGLDNRQLTTLVEEKNTTKISTRDFPYAIVKRLTGGTTVAATLFAAHQCGIRLLATGGIGGVHLDGEKSMDVSADLIEMSKTPMAVVSSGIKSILDLDKTLEYMETFGIGLASFKNSRHLPGFFSKESGRMVPYDVSSSIEAASILIDWMALNIGRSLLFCVPVPNEHSIEPEQINKIIKEADKDAKESGLIGKGITPFLLDRIVKKTSGKSLQTNVALVENNAKIAAQIAVEYFQVLRKKNADSTVSTTKSRTIKSCGNNTPNCLNSPIVVGGSNVDFIVKMTNDAVVSGGVTNLGQIRRVYGGVGRNLAEGLARLGLKPLFISAVGQDELGREIMASIPQMSQRGFYQCSTGRTATYCVVLQRTGDVYLGIGDMSIHQSISPQHIQKFADELRKAPLVAIDGNTPKESIEHILDICAESRTLVWYEPTDVNRASRPFLTKRWQSLSYVSPNLEELRHIYATITNDTSAIAKVPANSQGLESIINEAITLAKPLLEHIHCVIVTMGPLGLLVLHNGDLRSPFSSKNKTFTAVHYKAPSVSIASVSGSGDSLASTMMAGILTGRSREDCIQASLHAAKLSLQTVRTIPENLTYDAVFNVTGERYSPNASFAVQVDV